jgi:hypothetical protein
MMFESTDSETGKPLWGCPRLSEHGTGWLIDYYGADRRIHSVEVAKGEVLEWIERNPKAVDKMRGEVAAWKARKDC